MTTLGIRHRTAYRYQSPVALGPHRLMLRPRESRELRLCAFEVEVTPVASLAWANDVFGNVVATAYFQGLTDHLEILCRSTIELDAVAWPVFDIDAAAIHYPFRYSADEVIDLGALAVAGHPDPTGRLRAWAGSFVRGNPTDTLALLKDMCTGISAWISYQDRDDEGTQAPLETLDRGWGSCRDFALLFVEAVRSLGFGARIVSGYLDNSRSGNAGAVGGGSTHAWAEVYVPGAGWITFDPTNRSVGGLNLIPVAVGRDIRQVMPVAGSFVGAAGAFLEMTVDVQVAPAPAFVGD
ncbi:transglutaminase N-terminal domain-containing protein [Zavarzinia sp.]|uniref:transglutaminase family protein n=1 Tax=Zavarzinia sp. TaxID=2027920 RepID=UPI0035638933